MLGRAELEQNPSDHSGGRSPGTEGGTDDRHAGDRPTTTTGSARVWALWSPRAPADWLKAAASTTTALGVVTYAVLRLDYALFYDRFGLKPEDVGLGQAELISQSVSGVVLVVVVFFIELVSMAVVVWFYVFLFRRLIQALRAAGRREATRTAVLTASVLALVTAGRLTGATPAGPWLLVALGPVALWWLWRASRDQAPSTAGRFGAFGLCVFVLSVALTVSLWWTAAGLAGLLVLAVLVKRWSSRKESPPVPVPAPRAATPAAPPPPVKRQPANGQQRRDPPAGASRLVLALALGFAVALTETVLALDAVADASNVQSGHAVEPTGLGIRIASWGARAVDVAWTGEPPAGEKTLLDHCLLYLGQGDGDVVLYDHDAGRTLRIPAGAVVLSIRPAANYERVCPR